jgi:tRNA-2-methylthio-N6-dimethylallyladenosine synthase
MGLRIANTPADILANQHHKKVAAEVDALGVATFSPSSL